MPGSHRTERVGVSGPVATRSGRLIRVTDRVYCSSSYAISNVLYVITGKSVVVIDTTESLGAARASFDEFRKICSLPVSYIIYTHFHADHICGAKTFHAPSTKVIAQKRLPEELASVRRVLPYRRRATALQFGFHLPPRERGVTFRKEPEIGYIPPDILFDEQFEFREGDLGFELYHTQGESVDHLMVWVPEERVLFPGDLYYSNFPMLSNPMRSERPVLAWAESLERMRALHPLHLVPSHSRPVSGAEEVDAVLANYARAIRHVHDETVQRINKGLMLEEICRQVKLPGDLSRLPYLRERYGTVKWSVNGIFRLYAGWYSLNPTDLNPGPRAAVCRALLDASGGPAPLLRRARTALRQERNQLALELTDFVLGAQPKNRAAHAIRLRALWRLGAVSENGVEKNIYRTAAKRAAASMPARFNAGGRGLERLEYSGVWLRRPGQPARGEERASARGSARPQAPVHAAPAARPLQERTRTIVNRWYDDRMYATWAAARYGWSDFHNFGYWTPDTRTQKEACENLMEVLLAFIPRKAGTILDVACGKGATTRHLLNYYRPQAVTGINLSEKQTRTCRMNAPECNFFVMSATDLGFRDNCFDNLICVEAAFHFVTREKFLTEAYRVLKPGGRLVLTDIVARAPQGVPPRASSLQQVSPRRHRDTTSDDPYGKLPGFERVIRPGEYRDLYFRAGFERVEISDASEHCNAAHYKHSLRLLRRRRRRAAIDLLTFRQRRAQIVRNNRSRGYYLLVCAQKGDSK